MKELLLYTGEAELGLESVDLDPPHKGLESMPLPEVELVLQQISCFQVHLL